MNNEKSFVQISKIKKDIKNKIWKWIRAEKNLYIYIIIIKQIVIIILVYH